MSNIMSIFAKRSGSGGGGGSDAPGFIHIKSTFKRAPGSIFHYNNTSIIQK